MTRLVAAPDLDWRTDGLCGQVDPELFYPVEGGSPRDAIRVCRQCPAITQCHAYAMQRDDAGVWGGMTRHERRRTKTNRNAERKAS